MATKTISITEDAYKRLLHMKRDNESFSFVIQRITGGLVLSKIQGVLSNESAIDVEKEIKKNRKEDAKKRKIRINKIQEAFK